jgi:predicted Na+-dependent transporter
MVIPLGVMVTVAKCFIAIMLIMLVPTLLGIILDYCTEMQKNKKLITFLKFLLDEG